MKKEYYDLEGKSPRALAGGMRYLRDSGIPFAYYIDSKDGHPPHWNWKNSKFTIVDAERSSEYARFRSQTYLLVRSEDYLLVVSALA